MCDGHKHNLIVIISFNLLGSEKNVVRWCTDCGAVVVDGEYDGRTYPGKIVKMKFPNGGK